MTEWDFVFCAKTVKGKQEEMQSSFTGIIDALNVLKEESVYLGSIWKGDAGTSFISAFLEIWKDAKKAADETGNLIGAFLQIEKNFENADNEIAKLDY